MPTELRTELSPSDSTIRRPSPKLQPRCSYTYADGRRCRSTPAPDSSLCAQHASKTSRSLAPLALSPPVADEGTASAADLDVSSDLLGPIKDFRTAAAVNHTLGKLLILIASNRISPRRAAVVAYTCQLLLQSLDGVKHEISLTTDSEKDDEIVHRVLKATTPLRGRNGRTA